MWPRKLSYGGQHWLLFATGDYFKVFENGNTVEERLA
jgi:hypothetical protein